MKDTFNIVRVSGNECQNIDCESIIKKCITKPNMINYYYPHIFMNRETIDKEKIITLFNDHVLSIKRDKQLEHTIKRYNILNSILESLFLCVLDINDIKNIHKFSQYHISKDDNIITDLLNHIIENKSLYNLEQLLNDKIDNSHCVFIIEKMMDHIKQNYNDDNIEKKTLNNYQLLNTISNYLLKLKYNPFIVKIINCNKVELVQNYVNNCSINESHDTYINNIIIMYEEILKGLNPNEQINNIEWLSYFKKVELSLNISNQKEKVLKSIHRLTILDKINNILLKGHCHCATNNHNLIISIIEKNKLDKIIINSYINLIKNNSALDKLNVFERIIKYFTNLGHLSKELIKLILPKYFSKEKENLKYYTDIVARINLNTGNKIGIVDTILEQQRKIANDLKITTVTNQSNGLFNMEDVSLFNIDQKFNEFPTGNILKYTKELNSYATFTDKWFGQHFSNLKNSTINGFLSNGIVQMNNTIIHSNLIIINTLFMFNESLSILISDLSNSYNPELIDDIINTLEYYNIVSRIENKLVLNKSFFDIKQDIQIDFIKRVVYQETETIIEKDSGIDVNNDLIECYILKAIKPQPVEKDSLYDIVLSKIKGKTLIDKDIFDKCMKRLYNMDYYEIRDNLIVYVP